MFTFATAVTMAHVFILWTISIGTAICQTVAIRPSWKLSMTNILVSDLVPKMRPNLDIHLLSIPLVRHSG